MSAQGPQKPEAGAQDEIAELARRYLEDPDREGLIGIDRQVTQAAAESRWDDVSKWHRVRLRYLRYRQQEDLSRRHAWSKPVA